MIPGTTSVSPLKVFTLSRIGVERFLGLVEEGFEGLRRGSPVLGAGEIGDVVLVDVEFGLRKGRLSGRD